MFDNILFLTVRKRERERTYYPLKIWILTVPSVAPVSVGIAALAKATIRLTRLSPKSILEMSKKMYADETD